MSSLISEIPWIWSSNHLKVTNLGGLLIAQANFLLKVPVFWEIKVIYVQISANYGVKVFHSSSLFRLWEPGRDKCQLLFLCIVGIQMYQICGCCTNPVVKTIEHLFHRGDTSQSVWRYFSAATGISSLRCLKQNIRKWWSLDGNSGKR